MTTQDFPIENLPFGVVRPPGEDPRVVVRLGDQVLDLAAAGIAPELTSQPTLNALLASGRGGEIRDRAGALLGGRPRFMRDLDEVEVVLPIAVGDFVDFYSSLHHATAVGRIFRPGGDPLPPNWRRLPIGYHGRAGTIVVSGTPVQRPAGLIVGDGPEDVPEFAPTRQLDFELEVGFVIGGPPAARIRADDADRHVFGAVLLNDWSARDIQSFEHRPLGPFLAKSFATSISPWVVTLDALAPFLTAAPPQEPEPAEYLRARRPWALDLHLGVALNGSCVGRSEFAAMYWTFAQQLAHMTANGATARPGDMFGSGTVSGPSRAECGSMIELTRRGADPVCLPDGSRREFLEDGDTVTFEGWCGGAGQPRIGFGELTGTIVPAEGG